MKATDKQVNYLQALADKVEAIKKADPTIKGLPSYMRWAHERSLGMTVTDASARIAAYKRILKAVNTIRLLKCQPQF